MEEGAECETGLLILPGLFLMYNCSISRTIGLVLLFPPEHNITVSVIKLSEYSNK